MLGRKEANKETKKGEVLALANKLNKWIAQIPSLCYHSRHVK